MPNYSFSILPYGFIGISLMMLALWIYQCHKDDASFVDIGWAMGIALLTYYYTVFGQGNLYRGFLVCILTFIWSLRLSVHLFKRHKPGEEDRRYASLRKSWGNNARRNFFALYVCQTILACIFSLPAFLSTGNTYPLGLVDGIGIIIWLIAIIGESLADAQLNRFKSNINNLGKTCMTGLWRYSRHPNYFFEWLYWFSFIPWSLQYGWGWLSLCAPFIMLYLLVKVTGIPYAEELAINKRGDQYRNYQKTTNAFFPWFPQKV